MMDMLLQLGAAQRRVLGWALLALALLAGALYGVKPGVQAWRSQRAEHARAAQALAQLPAPAGAEALAQELAQLQVRLGAPGVPAQRLAWLMEQIQSAAQDCGVRLMQLAPAHAARLGEIDMASYEAALQGDYPRLAQFVTQIETRLAPLTVSAARFAAGAEGAPVTLHLQLAEYHVAEGPRP